MGFQGKERRLLIISKHLFTQFSKGIEVVLTFYSVARSWQWCEIVFSERRKEYLKSFDNELSDFTPVHVHTVSVGWRIFDF